MATQLDARVKQKTGIAADFAGYTLLEGEIALVRTSASGPVWNFKVGPGNFDSLDWSLQNPGAAQKADTSTVFPAGVPGLYIPTEDGTYEGETVDLSVGYVQLIWDGSTMTKVEFPIDLAGYATTASVSLKPDKPAVGIVTVTSGVNQLSDLASSDINNNDIWTDGFINTSGGLSASAEFRATGFISIPGYAGRDFDYTFVLSGNASTAFYDKDQAFLGRIFNPIPGATGPDRITSGEYTPPAGTAYMRVTHHKGSNTASINFSSQESFEEATSEVFMLSTDVSTLVAEEAAATKGEVTVEYTDKLNSFGLRTVPPNTNIYPDVLGISDLDNPDVWGNGFLEANGDIRTDAFWRHSDYLMIPEGTYQSNLYCAGNAVFWICNASKSITQVLSAKGNTTGTNIWSFTVGAGDKYIRVSRDTRLNFDAFIRTNVELEINDLLNAIEAAKDSGTSSKSFVNSVATVSATTKRNRPIITFISDDGHIENSWFLDALDQHNYKATFAIITGRFNSATYWSKQQVVDLFLAGHEVAGHTVSHDISNQLDTLTVDQLHVQIGDCKFDLQQLDDRMNIVNFISPFGRRNLQVDRVVRQYFSANYITVGDSGIATGEAINHPPIDNFWMKRVSFDSASGALDVSRLAIAQEAVDKVEDIGGWLIFAIHPHYPQYVDPENTVDSKQELRDLLDYIEGKGIPVMTAKQAREHYRNISYGNYRLDADYYEIGSDGTTVGNLL